MFLILLDNKKAFDQLQHSAIQDALNRRGAAGKMRGYLHVFRSNTKFRVRVVKSHSSRHPIMAGVPQGSVLSPFLFNFVLVTLSKALPKAPTIPLRLSIYADDVAL